MKNDLIVKDAAASCMFTFDHVPVDHTWSFIEKGRKDTNYATHGYHRYPAKFIPQLASRLILEHSNVGDRVVDPFMGCATTLVESKLNGRKSLGVDINPVSVLISKAKTKPLCPSIVENLLREMDQQLNAFADSQVTQPKRHERIDYWFKATEQQKLNFILQVISTYPQSEIRDFLYCCFSNILKNCSIWLQKSNKPTRDFNKKPADPIHTFIRHLKTMAKGNEQFYRLLERHGHLDLSCEPRLGNAKTIPVDDHSIDLIVTSPPYVTSYEYADLHQLTAFWMSFTDNLAEFRKDFIGSMHTKTNFGHLNSTMAHHITERLLQQDKKASVDVSNYFSEMNGVFLEMKRILKKGGKACIVIGNTRLKDVDILNAEVFLEQLQRIGLKKKSVIKREIPCKNLPSTRDSKTGRFASNSHVNSTRAYPTEYILIVEK
jgi:DNA modification methylase